jgi:hypothetical protein
VKRIKLLVGLLVALVILGAVSAPTASAQALDGVWLKCKINVKGYSVEPATGVYSKLNGSAPVYLHFVWNGFDYLIAVWTYADGSWANTANTMEPAVTPGENFISQLGLHFVFSSTDSIHTYHTPFIKYNNGKVTYKGTGEVHRGKVDGGTKNYYGYFNISGTSVDVSKLPFDPNP